MRRRDFIKGIVGSATTWPVVARAQQISVRKIGVLMASAENDPQYQASLAVFWEELRNLGWTEGHNIRADVRWAALNAEAMRRFASDLVALQPDLILSNDTPTTAALLQQTRTIPIVFATVSDPVGSSFVASLAHPGGNASGFSTIESSLGGKWLELLKEVAPHVTRAILLFNPSTAPYFGFVVKSFEAAASSHGVQAITAPVHDMAALEAIITAQAREPNAGLIVLNEDFTIAHRVEIISLAARYQLPTIYPFRFFAELGGLMSYGVDLVDNFRRAAIYADRILKGEKPADLPVQAPSKFQLVINLKTAKTLGLTVSRDFLLVADEVIE
jgi:putative tryptophan/tyrosine transport system substrate-binding protein